MKRKIGHHILGKLVEKSQGLARMESETLEEYKKRRAREKRIEQAYLKRGKRIWESGQKGTFVKPRSTDR